MKSQQIHYNTNKPSPLVFHQPLIQINFLSILSNIVCKFQVCPRSISYLNIQIVHEDVGWKPGCSLRSRQLTSCNRCVPPGLEWRHENPVPISDLDCHVFVHVCMFNRR